MLDSRKRLIGRSRQASPTARGSKVGGGWLGRMELEDDTEEAGLEEEYTTWQTSALAGRKRMNDRKTLADRKILADRRRLADRKWLAKLKRLDRKRLADRKRLYIKKRLGDSV